MLHTYDGIEQPLWLRTFIMITRMFALIIQVLITGACDFRGDIDLGAKLYAIPRAEQWGFIDEQGTIIIEPQYDMVSRFVFEGKLHGVMINQRWGFINRKGEFVIRPRFQSILEYSEKIAAVQEDGKWGYIDTKGEYVIAPQYSQATSFNNGVAGVVLLEIHGNKYVYIDALGNISDTKAAPTFMRGEGLTPKRKNNVWGYMDDTWEMVIPPRYDEAGRFSEGVAPVKIGDVWGYINMNGRIVIEAQYAHASSFAEGLAHVRLVGKGMVMFIDHKGVDVFEGKRFEHAGPFQQGLARVKSNNRWGYINKIGHLVIAYTYDYCQDFDGELARVQVDRQIGYVDKKGHLVYGPERVSPAILMLW